MKIKLTTIDMNFEIGNETPYSSQEYDCLLYSNETGFAPLTTLIGKYELNSSKLFMGLLKKAEETPLVYGVRFKEPKDHIKGCIIASGERSGAHQEFVRNSYSKPYRDFFYAMHYLSYELAENFIGASHLGVTHLTGGGGMPYYTDVAKCATEAFIHFKNKKPESPLKMTFTGCCLRKDHFKEIDDFIDNVNHEGYQAINVEENVLSDEFLEIKVFQTKIK